MQKKGIPSVAVVTERFLSLAEAVAKSKGMPDLPMVILPHNVEFMTPEDLKKTADRAHPHVAKALKQPKEGLRVVA